LEVGYVASESIRAPRRITYESAILRAEEQERASSQVSPVYTSPDPALARQQLDRARQVLDYLGSISADTLATGSQKLTWVRAVPELANLSPEAITELVSLSDENWNRVQLETLAVIDQAMRRDIREGHLDEVLELVPTLVGLDLSDIERSVTVALARTFLVPNSFLDSAATAEARAQAREEVPAVLRTFEADEIIVREGGRVTAVDIEALDQLGLRQPQMDWPDLVESTLFATVGTCLLLLYLAHFQADLLWDGHQLLLLVLLNSLFVVLTAMMVPAGSVLRYLAPVPALAMLTAAALGAHAGVGSAVFLGFITGIVADTSLEMTAYTTLGGLIAALTMGRVERIRAFFRSGAFVALVHLGVVVVFRLSDYAAQPNDLLISAAAGILNGGISASLALGGLFLIGPVFDVITTMRLIELSRPDHPLLQRLLREAPGTYHHSLMVANLAEQAAERIGANTLLTRVGAYYHDVGKITHPYFFTENQAGEGNPHNQLEPHASAEVIMSHIDDGLKLAARYRLPRRVRAFIPGHHGTNRVSFFYNRALEQADDPTSVNESHFRYHGPDPQSKETALVMLADGCEAVVRAERPASAEELAKLVRDVIAQRRDSGLLAESNLTLGDLETALEAFTSSLKGVFHPRIQYPRMGDAGDASE
jgi:putative nucleotidyltransferase with HDIG domain